MTGARQLLQTRLNARAEDLRTLREQVRAALRAAGYPPQVTAHVVLAINEAGMNIIQHGYGGASGEIGLEITDNDGELTVRMTDSAPPADRRRIRPRALEELRPGGLGTHFIRTIMDEVNYGTAADGHGNQLIMKKQCRWARGGGESA